MWLSWKKQRDEPYAAMSGKMRYHATRDNLEIEAELYSNALLRVTCFYFRQGLLTCCSQVGAPGTRFVLILTVHNTDVNRFTPASPSKTYHRPYSVT